MMQTVEQNVNSMTDDGIVVPQESGQAGEENQTGSDAEGHEDARREWEELINSPKFHALYTKQISDIVRKRLKSERESSSILQRATELLGLESPGQLPERIAELLTPQQRNWQQEAAAVKQKYPDFDLEAERAKEPFAKLLEGFAAHPEISLTSLYELFHLDSLQEKAAKLAAENTASQLLGAVQIRRERPHENGLAGAQANGARQASRLTRAQRAVLAERAAKGEHITF